MTTPAAGNGTPQPAAGKSPNKFTGNGSQTQSMPPSSLTPLAGLLPSQDRPGKLSEVVPFPGIGHGSDEDDASLDQSLLDAVALEDEAALRLLYARHARPLYAIAFSVLHDSHEAKDALQETFLRVWKQASGYRPERGAASTWMSFLARNTAIDFLRRRKRRPVVLEENPGRDLCSQEHRDAGLEHEQIEQCMTALSDPQRIALELAYFKGCTQSEIAKAMHIPLGNVKNHLKRGLHRLRELYTRHE